MSREVIRKFPKGPDKKAKLSFISRFKGAAGSKMPDSPVGERMCGSHRTGWIQGGHPNEDQFQKEVTRTVNFQWGGKIDAMTKQAKIMHCGDFFVYYLKDTSSCRDVYCVQ